MDRTLVQTFSDEDMQNPYVNNRLKALDNKISAKLSKNEIIADNEDPQELYQLYASDISDSSSYGKHVSFISSA